jgi:hypothetical protein
VNRNRIGGIWAGITGSKIEIQHRTRYRSSGGDARQIKRHHNRIGNRIIRPRVQIEQCIRRIVCGIDIQIRIAGWTDDSAGGLSRSHDRGGAGNRGRRGAVAVAAGVQEQEADRKHGQRWDECAGKPEPAHERLLRGRTGHVWSARSIAGMPRANGPDQRAKGEH